MQTCEVEKLRSWFLSQRRDLPWRENTTPYAVWVSEIMLQQTQVAVVIPYFQRWMDKFPTICSLAAASIEEVIKEWEGLGYYARARNLHAGAQYVVKNHAGELPETEAELRKIKGLGDYTIGAIRSFAFNHKAATVDGNVLRVLARYYGISDDISKMKSVKKFQGLAQSLLPEIEPWIISESLM
jgi:A/G-specific adenine glycosylase